MRIAYYILPGEPELTPRAALINARGSQTSTQAAGEYPETVANQRAETLHPAGQEEQVVGPAAHDRAG